MNTNYSNTLEMHFTKTHYVIIKGGGSSSADPVIKLLKMADILV